MRKLLCVVLTVVFVVFSACSQEIGTSPNANSSSGGLCNQGTAIDKVLSEEEQKKFVEFIEGINPEYQLFQSGVFYGDYKYESDKLVSVGIKGLPVLLTELEKMENNLDEHYRCMFFMACVNAIWRVNPISMQSVADVSNSKGYEKNVISAFYKNVNADAQKIVKSDKTITEKLHLLRRFGILAVPFVEQELNKGNTEYEEFFLELGLHLLVPEFMEIFGDPNHMPEESYEILKNSNGAESFDYKVWLSENRTDLDNMFKFLDEYTKQ